MLLCDFMVSTAGFEPATTRLQTEDSIQTELRTDKNWGDIWESNPDLNIHSVICTPLTPMSP